MYNNEHELNFQDGFLDITSPGDLIVNPESSDLCVQERVNPYRTCIQGRANEPISVLALLRRAKHLLNAEAGFAGLGEFFVPTIVRRLAENRPRVCIIRGAEDPPAHLLDDAHVLCAAARVSLNGGVPFSFPVSVIRLANRWVVNCRRNVC